jgi:hypothetical protein
MRVFGRYPAFWVGLIEAILAMALSWNQLGFHLNSERVALIMAAVTAGAGVYTAWVTKGTMLAVGVGFAKAILALAAGYGLALTADQTSSAIALLTLLLASFNHTQTSPLVKPTFREDPNAAIALR